MDLICEHNLWDRLKGAGKPIVMYGMGDGAHKIMRIFKQYQIPLAGIFASDEFVRGHSFAGFQVHTYKEICEKYDDFIVVLAFASHLPDVLEKILGIHKKHEVVAPDVPVAGDGLFTREYVKEHQEAFEKVYHLLADAQSKQVFADVINFKISGKIDYLVNCASKKSEVYTKLLKIGAEESFVDLGAYDGDTIAEFLNAAGENYRSILAIEPDAKNFRKLQNYIASHKLKNVQAYHMGIWDEKTQLNFFVASGRNTKVSAAKTKTMIPVDSLDHLVGNKRVTFIKMDVEGCELRALQGAAGTIKKQLPKLYVCAYHRNEDLFTLPLFIHKLSSDYQIYLRHSSYVPAWETNFYCVNKTFVS